MCPFMTNFSTHVKPENLSLTHAKSKKKWRYKTVSKICPSCSTPKNGNYWKINPPFSDYQKMCSTMLEPRKNVYLCPIIITLICIKNMSIHDKFVQQCLTLKIMFNHTRHNKFVHYPCSTKKLTPIFGFNKYFPSMLDPK